MSGKIKHRHQTAYTDDPTADVSADEWNDSLIVSEGSPGQFMVRDLAAPDGWSFHTFAASDIPAGGTLTVDAIKFSSSTDQIKPDGSGKIAIRNSTDTAYGALAADAMYATSVNASATALTIGTITLDPIRLYTNGTVRWIVDALGNLTDQGDHFIAIGPTPAATGALRLSPNAKLVWTNGAGTADGCSIQSTADQIAFRASPTIAVWLYAGTAGGAGASGNLYPETDAAVDLGYPGLRFRAAALSASLAIGTSPAQAGALRLANNAAVMARNNTNLQDANLIKLNASQYVVLADPTVTNGVLIDNPYLRFQGTTSAFPALRASGAELQAILSDASDYAVFRCKTILATASLQVTTNGFISVGTPAASAGAIRLPNAGFIYARSADNTSDVLILGIDSANRTFITSSLGAELYPGSGDGSASLGAPARRWSSGYFASIVETPFVQSPSGSNLTLAGIGATSGLLFYCAGANRWGINPSGTLYPVGDNTQLFGTSANRIHTLAIGTQIVNWGYHEFVEMAAPAAPSADRVRIYAEDNGGGKTRLMALFATGAAVQIAIQP